MGWLVRADRGMLCLLVVPKADFCIFLLQTLRYY